MKENKMFYLAIVANIAQLGQCFLYPGGALMLLSMFMPMHSLLFCMNWHVAKKLWQCGVLAVLHIAAAILTYHISMWLYFERICRDAIGEAIGYGGTLLAAIILAAIWCIIILVKIIIKAREKHKEKNTSENTAETE